MHQEHQDRRLRRYGKQQSAYGQGTPARSRPQQDQPMDDQQQRPAQAAPQFEDHLTNELRIALEDFNEVTHVAEWCAKECAYGGPQLAECTRVCEDIAEIAALNEKLIARDSMFGPDLAEAFVHVAREALPELERHQQRHPHVTETISAITRTIDSCETLLRMGERRQGDRQSEGGQRPQPTDSRSEQLY